MQRQPGRNLIDLWGTKNLGRHHEDNVDVKILKIETYKGWAVYTESASSDMGTLINKLVYSMMLE